MYTQKGIQLQEKKKKTRENYYREMFFNTNNSLVMLSFWNPSTAVDPFISDVCCYSQPLFDKERELQWFVALKKKWQNAVPLYEVSFNSTQKLTTQLNKNTKLYQKSQALEITLFQLISWYILGSQGLNQLSQSNDDNVKSQEL